MTRPLRPDVPGAWHHVMNRGARRQEVFLDDTDRLTFLDLVAEQDVEIHGYALMGNHYHLLIHTPTGGLSEAMRRIGGEYTLNFNRRHGRDGALFRGRFHSSRIASDSYLLAVSRYVHRNPLEAGLVRSNVAAKWTSCRAFYGLGQTPEWLHTSYMLDLAGGPAAYADYVENRQRFADHVTRQLDRSRPPQVLGDEPTNAGDHQLATLCGH